MERGFRISFSVKLIATIFVVLLVLSVALSLSMQQISVKNFTEIEQQLLSSRLHSIRTQINGTLDSVRDATIPVIMLPQLRELADSDPNEAMEQMVLSSQIRLTLYDVIADSSYHGVSPIAYLGVELENGTRVEAGQISENPFFADYQTCCRMLEELDLAQKHSYSPTLWFTTATADGVRCLAGVRFLYRPITMEKYGFLIIAIPETGLQNLLNTINRPLCLMRKDGTVLLRNHLFSVSAAETCAASQPALLALPDSQALLLPDGSTLWHDALIGDACRIVCLIGTGQPSGLSDSFTRQIVGITAIALTAGLLLAWGISRSLTGSLRRLTGTVQQVYRGDLSARFVPTSNDEIAYLGMKINDMLIQVEDSLRTQEEDAAIKQDLQLQLLHAQINPHLLYNTLNSVAWCIRQNDADTANRLIFSLSSFFRLTLSKGKDEIPLDDELAMIHHYLQIQNLGRGKAYSLRDEVPEEWRTCKVLRLTLQPLVENAVIHGFSDWRDDGEITVIAEAGEDGTALRITVRDNGIGILPEDLRSLRSQLQVYPPRCGDHYGLYNIHQRLRNKYGRAFGLSIESQVGEFTAMTLTYPIEKET